VTANPSPPADERLRSGESAIIVPVELPVAARQLRDRLDPEAARGVPAHITLLYPFVPPDALSDDLRADLRRLIGAHPAFPFTLARVERWPAVVWLAPEPAAPFSRLIDDLRAAYPAYPPYGGIHDEVIPHLTIAQDPRPGYLEAAEHALPGLLPIRGVTREAWLIAHSPAERWHTLWRLPLAATR
jgi:2'-5' RNA ligase